VGEPQNWFTRAFCDRAVEEAYRDDTARRTLRAYRVISVLALVGFVFFNQIESRLTDQSYWLGTGNVRVLMAMRQTIGIPLFALAAAFGWAPFRWFRRFWPLAWIIGMVGVTVVPAHAPFWMPQPQLLNLGIAAIGLNTMLVVAALALPIGFVYALLLELLAIAAILANLRVLHGSRDVQPVYFWFFFGCWISVVLAWLIEAHNRRSFLQLRALEKERARADVAERAREMSEALLRMAGAPRVPSRVQPGDVIDRRYRVIKMLGSGGMGQVHEVERLVDGRHLALKILTGSTDREALLRFAREAQIAAEIVHPNVVSVFDVGVAQSGMFLVMELVSGAALSAHKDRYGDAAWALSILKQVAGALAAMHARGIVHRDLKPANVLLDGDRAKVADFGIATVALPAIDGGDSTVRQGARLTQAGVIMGTPLYMAPELDRGAAGATPSSDLFSLGVMAFELLGRKLPFSSAPVLERLRGANPPKPPSLAEARPDLPSPLVALVDRCLAYSPESRPAASEVIEAL
jgi:hypothetical protein